ncbi:hypothetical protein J7E78_01435 [Paenibacillus polymyxa]|uniref:hypothetical protein n=1 Tax=Paenibacillus polymyxa TaxID=1406 RepID=UPI001BE87CB9|nr:hypothetical protein [Paenibacillus polymyxa]MBT2282214.1 hypothetical protein [Paenibacillus polymyxa]
MTISNANKQAVCEKYRIYLEIIYSFGNKVMLMKQLYHYAQMMGIAKSYSAFYISIIELVDADIFRKESFNAFGKKTQLHMLVMRKYGIRFLEEKPDSYSVASVKKALGNERILVSIFKNHYILNKIIPRIQKEGTRVTFGAIIDLLERDHSTILYNKNQGLSFLGKMKNEATLQKYLDMLSIEQDNDKMQDIQRRMGEGLRKGSEASDGKGGGKHRSPEMTSVDRVKKVAMRSQDLNKEERVHHYTLDTMLSFNAYIAQIKISEGQVKITALIFDIFNRSNIYKVATHIACMYHMFTRYFNDQIELKIGVVSIDEFASNHLKTQAESATIDFVSKERRDSRLTHILEKWHIDRFNQEKIEVQFVDYDITNQFLDGIKHANLVRR